MSASEITPLLVLINLFFILCIIGLSIGILVINRQKDRIIDKAVKIFTLVELKLDILDEIRDDIKKIINK